MNQCLHIYQPIPVGNHFVYASGTKYVTAKDYIALDLSVYLDVDSWSRIRGIAPIPSEIALSKIPIGYDNDGQFIYVRWPDFDAIGQDRLNRLVNLIIRAMKRGLTVEVGCIGAHGRTGSLIAATIARVEGLGALDAIRETRSRYCVKAVETKAQENMLYTFCGEEPPISTIVNKAWPIDFDVILADIALAKK